MRRAGRGELGVRRFGRDDILFFERWQQTLTPGGYRRRIAQRKRCFEIGFDDICRRRQDVADQIVCRA